MSKKGLEKGLEKKPEKSWERGLEYELMHEARIQPCTSESAEAKIKAEMSPEHGLAHRENTKWIMWWNITRTIEKRIG